MSIQRNLFIGFMFFIGIEFSKASYADEATLSLQIPLLSFNTGESESEAQTIKRSSLNTSSNYAYGWIYYKQWLLYIYPFSDANQFGLSYMPIDILEIGSGLAKSDSKGGGDRVISSSLSPYITYYYTLYDSFVIESTITCFASKMDTKNSDGSTVTKTNGYNILVSGVYSLTKKMAGVASFSHTQTSEEVDTIKTDSKDTNISLNIRYNL